MIFLALIAAFSAHDRKERAALHVFDLSEETYVSETFQVPYRLFSRLFRVDSQLPAKASFSFAGDDIREKTAI